jgi:ferric-dicitrate binding protein FerR (iron transport regulator)
MDKRSSRQENELARLFRRFLANECTPDEIDELFMLFRTVDDSVLSSLVEQKLKEYENNRAATQEEQAAINSIHSRVVSKLSQDQSSRFGRKIRNMRFVRAAAAIFILAACYGLWYYYIRPPYARQPVPVTMQPATRPPGHSGAVLSLSNGSRIILDSAENGVLAKQGDVKIIKEDGQIKYSGSSAEVAYNTVTTKRGRQWKLILPDGTRVWLNAESSITYPTVFTGNERKVQVSGEAYFEVAHHAQQPFLVTTGNQTIEDMGTAFNVNAYPDEDGCRTTLIEGSVKVLAARQQCILKPGQQARLSGSLKVVNDVDLEDVVAWKKGQFILNGSDIKMLMRQISRWYDVDVVYSGTVPDRQFGGVLDRNIDLLRVLQALQENGVNCKLDGRVLRIGN